MAGVAPPLSRRQRKRANRRAAQGANVNTSTFHVPIAFNISGGANKDARGRQDLVTLLAPYEDNVWVRECAVQVVCTKPKYFGRYAFFESAEDATVAKFATATHARPFCKGVVTSLSHPAGRMQIKDLKHQKICFIFEDAPLPEAERPHILACTLHLRLETTPSVVFPRDSDAGNATATQFYMQHING